jgi:hypothetical protein
MSEHGCLPPRRTGRADFPHPALTQTLAARQYAGPGPLSRAAKLGSPMRTVPQPRGRFFRIGTFVQAEFPPSYPNRSAFRPLRSTIVTRFFAVGSEEARLRASHRPPLKLHVRFSRMQLSRRLKRSGRPEKELIAPS